VQPIKNTIVQPVAKVLWISGHAYCSHTARRKILYVSYDKTHYIILLYEQNKQSSYKETFYDVG